MKIAIVSSSTFNIYASALIARLISDGNKPIALICVRKSWLREMMGYIERHGVRGATNKVLQVLRLKSWPGSDHWAVMSDYAQKHGLNDWRTPLPQVCKKHDIHFQRVEKLSADNTAEFVRRSRIDLLLNAGGDLFRKNIIQAPRQGVFNVHKGLLPSYRGYNVVEWSLFNRHPAGVTLHYVDVGLDTGDVIQTNAIPIEKGDVIDTIRARSYPLQVELMAQGVRQLVAGTIERTRQAKADGRQYFSMHPRLKAITEKRLRHDQDARWRQRAVESAPVPPNTEQSAA